MDQKKNKKILNVRINSRWEVCVCVFLSKSQKRYNKNKWPPIYEEIFHHRFHMVWREERTNSNWLSFRLHFNKSEAFDWIVTILKEQHATLTASTTNTNTNNNTELFNKKKKRKEIRRAWLMMCTSHIWVYACVFVSMLSVFDLVEITIRRRVQEQKQIRFFEVFGMCVCPICVRMLLGRWHFLDDLLKILFVCSSRSEWC